MRAEAYEFEMTKFGAARRGAPESKYAGVVQSRSRIVPSGSQQVLRQKIRSSRCGSDPEKLCRVRRPDFRSDDGRNEDPATTFLRQKR